MYDFDFFLEILSKAIKFVFKYIWWVLEGTQVVCLQIGMLVLVTYDASVVASITTIVMKNRGMSNGLTKLFDSLITGKVVQGIYGFINNADKWLPQVESNILITFLAIVFVLFTLLIILAIANAIIWWPFMLGSIIIQLIYNFVMFIRRGQVKATSPAMDAVTPVSFETAATKEINTSGSFEK